ncbi:MAG: DUF937 domain-containing protein [Gammaproteobacteria bacterium]|nr:DUF937 domain-containing protein [Gammaproteobacteria bacterium]MBU1414144.1 DUF937 domain-containing protein [Gammaproteobacteria bacterium]
MGLLDSILSGALGQGQSQASPDASNSKLMAALLPVVLSMLGGQQGGGSSLGNVLGGMLGGNQGGGGLGGMLGSVLGGGGQGNAAAGGLGGLGALLNGFQQAGLADRAASWVGTGQNMPISADDVGKVLGSDAIAKIAQQAGVSHGDASSGLAALLPQLVDHLTPNGQMPEGGQLEAGLGDLLKQFGRA